MVREPHGSLSPNGDMGQTSRGKLDRLPRTPAESTLRALDGYGLRGSWPARPALAPSIRFLSIGSRVCSTLPSDPASRRRPCASLTLHLHQVGWGTFTPKLSNMLGTPRVRALLARSPRLRSRPAGDRGCPLTSVRPRQRSGPPPLRQGVDQRRLRSSTGPRHKRPPSPPAELRRVVSWAEQLTSIAPAADSAVVVSGP
jgi:hypothetical protein